MIDSKHFAIVTRDESWSLGSRLVTESRLIHGSADQRGATIDARDDRDDELLVLCDRESDRVREAIASLREGRARAVVTARSDSGVSATISLSVRDLSVVTTLPHLAADYEMLIDLASVSAIADAGDLGVPLVWRNGSGAVLMHEAAGHPAEDDQPTLEWPSWLRVETPLAMRRESFTDVPLRRMAQVTVTCVEAGFSPPSSRYIEILLVAGGRYEPLADRVSLSISAANRIDGNESIRLRPFMIDEPRESIARSLRGASGDVRRYPGVICSKEGQNVFVGSHSPDLVTEFR
ncbi:MAG TPA: hypothetical protein VF505_19875 [Thermoanaerobaculia bacterium]